MLFILEIQTILLPTDFSECANHALPYAASLARRMGARIICLHVVAPISPAVGYTPMAEPLPVADLGDQLAESAARELPKVARHEECEGVDVEEIITHGEPAADIVRFAGARGADLIDKSSHGRAGLGRLLFGSTAESVVRHAPCPVLVVKPPPSEG